MKHCPNCVSEMKPDRKKLGHFTKWIVCVSCGYRTRPDVDTESPNIIKRVSNNKRIIEDEANGYYNES